MDTGELLLYKDDLVKLPQTAFIPTIREEEEEEEDRDEQEIFSIIGHLERDEQKLYEKLRDSPELAEPIIEAQAQLNRLKDLMFNIFGRRTSPPHEVLQLTFPEDKSTSPPAANTSSFLSSTTHQRRPSLRIEESMTHPSESTRLDDGRRNERSSTRPLANFRLGQPQQVFSPISAPFVAHPHRRRPEDHEVDKENDSPSATIGSRREEEDSMTDVGRDDGGLTYDRSLTRFSLSDLSRRLGGTGLCYSRDDLLEITERLQGNNSSSAPSGRRRKEGASTIADTADELEKLMLSLSGKLKRAVCMIRIRIHLPSWIRIQEGKI